MDIANLKASFKIVIDLLSKKSDNSNVATNDISTDEVMASCFPIDSLEALETFEANLKDKLFFKNVVST